jgi:hypothetical protein
MKHPSRRSRIVSRKRWPRWLCNPEQSQYFMTTPTGIGQADHR